MPAQSNTLGTLRRCRDRAQRVQGRRGSVGCPILVSASFGVDQTGVGEVDEGHADVSSLS